MRHRGWVWFDMPRKPEIEFILPHETERFDGALVGGGVIRKQGGRIIYRVMLRAGEAPQCTINGEPYADPAGQSGYVEVAGGRQDPLQCVRHGARFGSS